LSDGECAVSDCRGGLSDRRNDRCAKNPLRVRCRDRVVWGAVIHIRDNEWPISTGRYDLNPGYLAAQLVRDSTAPNSSLIVFGVDWSSKAAADIGIEALTQLTRSLKEEPHFRTNRHIVQSLRDMSRNWLFLLWGCSLRPRALTFAPKGV